MLGINDAVTRLWFSSALFPGLLNQMLENGVPESGYSRASIEAVHGGLGREIMGQLSPFASRIDEIEDGVGQFPFAPFVCSGF